MTTRTSARVAVRRIEITLLRGRGFSVDELTPDQFRIGGRLDLFPASKRYHDIETGAQGTYTVPLGVALHVLGWPKRIDP